MKIRFISMLNNKDQRGGAYLRDRAICEIYKALGFDIQMTYLDEMKVSRSWLGYVYSFYIGENVHSLFNTAEINVDDCDYIHLDCLRQLRWKRKKNYKKIIFNAHNLEFETYVARENEVSRNKLKKYEFDLLKTADIIWVCSQRERDILINYDSNFESKVFVIPNLVDCTNYRFESSEGKNKILFLGTLDYYPNVKAVEYICDNLIKKHTGEYFPSFEFVIAGKSPTEDLLKRIKEKEHIVTLRVNLSDSEVVDLLAEAYIVLVPIMHGSGTRLKIIEALMSKAIVLSTPIGREGIESEMIFESTLQNFEIKLHELLATKQDFSEEAYEKFKSNFDTKSWFEKNHLMIKSLL